MTDCAEGVCFSFECTCVFGIPDSKMLTVSFSCLFEEGHVSRRMEKG